ncbi:MAG: CoA transferase [Chloroflexota bacterium]|nr:MAG: CoA transferase [Chloroflexota bacterium]
MSKALPLQGVKVADFGWLGIGPLTAMRLAIWGATVVRVESHTRPGSDRIQAPYKDGIPGINRSGSFARMNRGKYGISINLNRPTGLAIAWRLIKWADVMDENFTPGQMKKWGLDYESVKKVKPDIIYMTTNLMGGSGPYAAANGYGYQAAGVSGITYPIGWSDRGPSPYHAAYPDFANPRLGAAAILAALHYRAKTGKGQYLDQSQMEGIGYCLMAPHIMSYETDGVILERSGNLNPSAAPHNVYPCKGDDRWCAIAVSNSEQWRALVAAMGRPELADDPRFSTLLERKKNEAELDALIAQWTVNMTRNEVETVLQKVGVPAHSVEDTRDLRKDPQLDYRQYWQRLTHSEMGDATYRGTGYTLSKGREVSLAAPCLGEHNEYVFKQILGMTDDEISEALIEGGITTDADLPEMKGAI